MLPKKVYRLFITPQTHVRTTKREKWMFAKTDAQLLAIGTGRYLRALEKNPDTSYKPTDFINRRNQIKRYFDYKRALKQEAALKLFVIPEENVWLKFYVPMPKSWRKKKRNQLLFEQKKSAPDIDNYVKGFIDGLLTEDKRLSDYRASKFWCDGETGFIEIHVGTMEPAIGYTKIFWDWDQKIR